MAGETVFGVQAVLCKQRNKREYIGASSWKERGKRKKKAKIHFTKREWFIYLSISTYTDTNISEAKRNISFLLGFNPRVLPL
jgi:hypothetical protein